jgi:hypothetical protein
MNISEALKTARTLFAGEDYDLKAVLHALHVLELEGGDKEFGICKTAYRQFPHLLDYDEKGNWIGNVANENGWTA